MPVSLGLAENMATKKQDPSSELVAQILENQTEYFIIFELQNLAIVQFYEALKCWPPDCKALKQWKVRSGNQTGDLVEEYVSPRNKGQLQYIYLFIFSPDKNRKWPWRKKSISLFATQLLLLLAAGPVFPEEILIAAAHLRFSLWAGPFIILIFNPITILLISSKKRRSNLIQDEILLNPAESESKCNARKALSRFSWLWNQSTVRMEALETFQLADILGRRLKKKLWKLVILTHFHD